MHLKIKLYTKGKRVVMDAAYRAHPAHPVVPANRVNPVDLEIPAILDSPACRRRKFVFHQRPNRANLAHLAHQDLPVHQETMASSDPLAATVLQAKTALSVHQARPVPPALPANRVATVPEAIRAAMPSATTPYPANAEPTANRANKDRPAPTGRPDKTVNPDSQARAVHPARPDKTAKTATKGTKDLRARPANRESAACARNIALWTEAFSSKTARGDKLYNKIGNIQRNDKFGLCKLPQKYFTTTTTTKSSTTLHQHYYYCYKNGNNQNIIDRILAVVAHLLFLLFNCCLHLHYSNHQQTTAKTI